MGWRALSSHDKNDLQSIYIRIYSKENNEEQKITDDSTDECSPFNKDWLKLRDEKLKMYLKPFDKLLEDHEKCTNIVDSLVLLHKVSRALVLNFNMVGSYTYST